MIKSRLSKLEKTQRDKQLKNGGMYLVYIDEGVMEIDSGQGILFTGPVEAGEKMITKLNIPGSIIIRLDCPKSWAQ